MVAQRATILHARLRIDASRRVWQDSHNRLNLPAARGWIEAALPVGASDELESYPRAEDVDYSDYRDLDDACEQLANWLQVEYMIERIHVSLNYLTPAEFEAAHFVDQRDTLLAEA
jgi:transposase InsO family protein